LPILCAGAQVRELETDAAAAKKLSFAQPAAAAPTLFGAKPLRRDAAALPGEAAATAAASESQAWAVAALAAARAEADGLAHELAALDLQRTTALAALKQLRFCGFADAADAEAGGGALSPRRAFDAASLALEVGSAADNAPAARAQTEAAAAAGAAAASALVLEVGTAAEVGSANDSASPLGSPAHSSVNSSVNRDEAAAAASESPVPRAGGAASAQGSEVAAATGASEAAADAEGAMAELRAELAAAKEELAAMAKAASFVDLPSKLSRQESLERAAATFTLQVRATARS
jgi:hypothetical protein